jgi:nitrogen-specific signal transduction histidine kinase
MNESAELEQFLLSTRRVAAGLTHELNSALQCLGDALFTLDEAQAEIVSTRIGDIRESLRIAEDACSRLTEVAQSVAELVPPISHQERTVSLAGELRRVGELTRHFWKNTFNLVVSVEPGLGPIRCDWWAIRQVIVRLILDACDTASRSASRTTRTTRPTLELAARSGRAGLIEIYLEFCPLGAEDAPATSLRTAVRDEALRGVLAPVGGRLETVATSTGTTRTTVHFSRIDEMALSEGFLG